MTDWRDGLAVSVAYSERVVSDHNGRESDHGCCMRTDRPAQAGCGSHGVIGERRLWTWEAVAFGVLHVESVLAYLYPSGLLEFRS